MTEQYSDKVEKRLDEIADHVAEASLRVGEKALYVFAGIGLAFAGQAGLEKLKAMPAHPDGDFELVRIDRDMATVKQDGKEYTINATYIPEEVKQRILENHPELESFINNGPIKIVSSDSH